MRVSAPVSVITVTHRHRRLKTVRVHGRHDVDAGCGEEARYARVCVVVFTEEFREGDEKRTSNYFVTVHVT